MDQKMAKLALAALILIGNTAAKAEGIWDLTGPIDPNYAIEATNTSYETEASTYVPDEYSRGNFPFEARKLSEPNEIAEALARLSRNEANEFDFLDSKCDTERLASDLERYRRDGYELKALEILPEEVRDRGWSGAYHRLNQKLVIKLGHRDPKHTGLQRTRLCPTRFWRWE